MSKTRTATRVLVVGLLALHAGLLLDSIRKNFVTIDEVGHVAAGISHWQTGTYSMYRVNPPLPRMLAVLPVLAADPDTTGIQPSDVPGFRSEWPSGAAFASANATRYHDLICLARLAGILWSLLGGWLVYRWARELYGEAAGLLGLALWCFEPNILANAQMVTPDLPSTVAGLAATYVFWHYLRKPSWSLAWFAGLLLGIAQLTKFTLLVLYGVWPVLWLLHRFAGRGQCGTAVTAVAHRVRFLSQLGQAIAIFALSVLVLHLGYAFDGSFRQLGEFSFVSKTLRGEHDGGITGNRFRDTWLGHVPVPLPADYLLGIDVQRRDFEEIGKTRGSYLAGQWRDRGWWYYYLYALGCKVPLGLWVLFLWSLTLTLWGHRIGGSWSDEWTVGLPALVVLVFVSSQTGFNHHLRYVLPILPFALISTSKLARFFAGSPLSPGPSPRHGERGAEPLSPGPSPRHGERGAEPPLPSQASPFPRREGGRGVRFLLALSVLALFLWAAGSSLAIHPHYLSYFNELAGGPDRGHDHLVDSNIDWGQDLLFLKKWLDEHPEARPLKLAYFNLVDPRLAGIDYTLPPLGPTSVVPADPAAAEKLGPQPGYYAVSVNFVRGMTFSAPGGKGRSIMIPLHGYSYFQRFQPIAKAGYSIFIYHITLEQANTVRREMGLPLLEE